MTTPENQTNNGTSSPQPGNYYTPPQWQQPTGPDYSQSQPAAPAWGASHPHHTNPYTSAGVGNYPTGHPYRAHTAGHSNGVGIAALATGLAAVPLVLAFSVLGVAVGFVAVVLGVIGLYLIRSGTASNKALPIGGIISGGGAMLFGIALTLYLVVNFVGFFKEAREGFPNQPDPLPTQFVSTDDATTPDMTGSGSSDDSTVAAVGETHRIGDWDVTVHRTVMDATADILAENPYNDRPDSGQQFVMAYVTLTNTTNGYLSPIMTYFDLIDSSGTVNGLVSNFAYCGVVPDSLETYTDVAPGNSVSGNVCVAAPSSKLNGATWQVTIHRGDFSQTDVGRFNIG
ncbi:DUF4352 domain-containing protein [Hoyosella rhizosphaerae]|uniref:DUF4352 domain-containing protein n=1 Tax=Hoyosella rhizosphaerae TaxID=1755582 RepID=A0A916XFI1_9ACTN|nr:DUF4352 domain-containing protein [Hoyosella rhizosphaerae]MBN4925555.1 DUF4352 domain-containing protein [Hoyosella rhizosphaerae]GGC69736.1 hypothetical protein GCM10011410_23220 [Hoyosella rhizosphaerae]